MGEEKEEILITIKRTRDIINERHKKYKYEDHSWYGVFINNLIDDGAEHIPDRLIKVKSKLRDGRYIIPRFSKRKTLTRLYVDPQKGFVYSNYPTEEIEVETK
jgi:hypothetical protein